MIDRLAFSRKPLLSLVAALAAAPTIAFAQAEGVAAGAPTVEEEATAANVAEPASAIEAASAETTAEETVDASIAPAEAKAVDFVRAMLADAEAALTDEDKSDAARLAAFETVLREALAYGDLGPIVVSRRVYEGMSEDQRTRYDLAFPEYMSEQYARQFDGILGKPFEIVGTVVDRNDVFVRTRFMRDEGTPLNVDWRTRDTNGEIRIYDFIVNGVSIMRVKYTEFKSFVEANGVDALIVEIEKAAVAAPAPAASQETGDVGPSEPATGLDAGEPEADGE